MNKDIHNSIFPKQVLLETNILYLKQLTHLASEWAQTK